MELNREQICKEFNLNESDFYDLNDDEFLREVFIVCNNLCEAS